MDERTCSVDGCGAATHARGMCGKHYTASRRQGVTDLCSISGCDKLAQTRGWCPMHYQRWRHNGDPLKVKRVEERRKRPKVNGVEPCTIDGCNSVQKARGWCSMHWERWKRLGDPLGRLRGEVRDGKRICPGCGIDKPIDQYGASEARCLPCQAENMRLRRATGKYKAPEVAREQKQCGCGATFMADKRRSRYCSPECFADFKNRNNWVHLNRRRARLREALVEAFDRLDIFERDGWVCQIYGEPVDEARKFPDPLSVSLDHVIPVARGGKHEPGNAQTAHLICNIRKSDKIA